MTADGVDGRLIKVVAVVIAACVPVCVGPTCRCLCAYISVAVSVSTSLSVSVCQDLDRTDVFLIASSCSLAVFDTVLAHVFVCVCICYVLTNIFRYTERSVHAHTSI